MLKAIRSLYECTQLHPAIAAHTEHTFFEFFVGDFVNYCVDHRQKKPQSLSIIIPHAHHHAHAYSVI